MKRMLISSLISAIATGCISIHGIMPDSFRITGAVGMYYLIWWAVSDGLEWVEKRWKKVKKR